MSNFKKQILKPLLVLGFISVGVTTLQSRGVDGHAMLETIETQSHATASFVGEKSEPVYELAGKVDENVKSLNNKAKEFQSNLQPQGYIVKQVVADKASPVIKAATWADHTMSLPAILLMLVFAGVFFLLGVSGPSSHLGGHH